WAPVLAEATTAAGSLAGRAGGVRLGDTPARRSGPTTRATGAGGGGGAGGADDGVAGGQAPVGDRDAGVGGGGHGRADPGDDLERHPGLGQGEGLLAAAGEQQRVPPPETAHRQTTA